MRSIGAGLVASLSLAAALHAQAPAAPAATSPVATPPAAASPATPRTAEAPPPASQDGYTYQPDGRRDPFLNLIGTGPDTKPTGKKSDGVGGIAVSELSVRGVLQSRGALVAMVAGADNKTYIVHQGDKLADGTIKSITPRGLVVVQEVNDPLSLVKQREVSKLLRAVEGAKE
jgi:type IV pilus assembly protein PilP